MPVDIQRLRYVSLFNEIRASFNHMSHFADLFV